LIICVELAFVSGCAVIPLKKDSPMQKFELGFAFRGSTAPEVKRIVEARSMREAMLSIIDQNGGNDVVLVTHAQYFQEPELLQPCPLCGPETCSDAASFMLAPR
jgi:hypothetical protein